MTRVLTPAVWQGIGTCAALIACAVPCRADPGARDADPAALPASEVMTTRPAASDPVSARALQQGSAADLAAVPREAPLPVATLAPPHWSSSAELAGDAYRLSLSRGAVDLGMSFDTATRASRPHDVRIDTQGPVMAALPSVSLGLHQGGAAPASSLLERATRGGSDDYTSKLGVQWKPAESNVSFLRGGLGVRLDGNESVTMRLRKGLLGVYFQRRF
jgi:hypothetical protein